MSDSQPEWVEWVRQTRQHDAAAREQLEQYFNPFVHAVVVARVAHHLAAGVVLEVMKLAQQKLPTLPRDTDYATWLLDLARAQATLAARTPGATIEQPAVVESVKDGRKVLSSLRSLPESTRERLTMRLLEGVSGAEIAEVTGAGHSEVRNELERGLTQLCRDLTGSAVSAAGDPYLWSMVGAPHAAVIPLENQLTPLRYDAGGRRPARPQTTPLSTGATEGRRLTPDQSVNVADEEQTNPAGVDVVGLKQTSDFGSERTLPVTDLPAPAQVNPFEQQPATIPVTDLPAAAAVTDGVVPPILPGSRRAAPPPRPSLDSRAAPRASTGEQRVLKAAAPASAPAPRSSRPAPSAPEEADSTGQRGVPLSMLARGHAAPGAPARRAETDWRSSVDEERLPTTVAPTARARPASLVRGWYPFAIAGFFLTISLTVAWVDVHGSERAVRRGWNLVQVVVAGANLTEGTTVTMDMLSTRGVPENFVTSSVVKPDSVSGILDKRIMVPVQVGDPMLWSQFEQSRLTERLSTRVTKRARAYSLDASGTAAVGGWVRPGDHVDLIFTARELQLRQLVAVTLLEDLPVIATGKLTASTNLGLVSATDREYQNVSVMVLPEEAEMLSLVRGVGNFKLSLRNENDNESLSDKGRSEIDTLLSGERNKKLQEKRLRSIQMIRDMPGGSAVPAPVEQLTPNLPPTLPPTPK